MKVYRVFSGPEGRSSIESVDVEVHPVDGKTFVDSDELSLAGVGVLRRFPQPLFSDWHNPKRRQLIVVLSGTVEVEAGDGSRLSAGPGEIMLFEDFDGPGHITRFSECECFYVPVAADFDVKGEVSTFADADTSGRF